jgi:glycosyltransferase involved in cell wall biosynthesis
MRAEIEQRCTALGVTDHVIIAGMQPDVRPFIAAFDVGILCSISIETLSLAALEVMAMGIPMVMSELGGASEIVNGENGMLFPVGDGSALVEALAKFFHDRDLAKTGAAARLTTEVKFDHRAMVANYFNHFVHCCS